MKKKHTAQRVRRSLGEGGSAPARRSLGEGGFSNVCILLRLLVFFAGLLLALFAAANPQRLTHYDARRASEHVRRVNGPPVAPAGGVYAAWVTGYNGPGNGGDAASAIAVDDSGNVYVTGGSDGVGIGSDYATIKYDSSGQQQWVARYTGFGGYGNDTAYAIVVDHST